MQGANEVDRKIPINKSRKCFCRGQWGQWGLGLQNDSSTWLLFFSFNEHSRSQCRIFARLELMHPGSCFIYISYHYCTVLCIQMSFTQSRRSVYSTLPVLQIQLILLMPPGLNQYAWIKVSVINTRLVFQETLFLFSARALYLNNFVYVSFGSACSGSSLWHGMLTKDVFPEVKGEIWPKHAIVSHPCDEWPGYDLEGGLCVFNFLPSSPLIWKLSLFIFIALSLFSVLTSWQNILSSHLFLWLLFIYPMKILLSLLPIRRAPYLTPQQ